MVKLKIAVTKDVLERAKYCGTNPNHAASEVPTNCAVALAVRDIFPDAWVTGEGIDVYKPGTSSLEMNTQSIPVGTIDLPIEVQEFIEDFDSTLPEYRPQMPELEFEVEVPDSVISMISLDEIKSLLKNSSTMELVEQ
jgi:hypothetical protein